jgi:uncharacterized membrane protein
MPFPTHLVGLFIFIIFLIVILPMLFLGTSEVASKKTESLGIAGLIEGMQKNFIIMIILLIIAINVIIVWAYVIFNVTPK